MIKRNVGVGIEPTPRELAEEFCNMNSDDQALFLLFIADITSTWDGRFESQLQNIIESKNFLTGANRILRLFGEYADALS